MEPSYSVWADILSKFHTSSEWIQALWLISPTAMVVGVAWCVAAPLRDWASTQRKRADAHQELTLWLTRDVRHSGIPLPADERPALPEPQPDDLREIRRLLGRG
jgi:hypothetical protein